MPLKTEDPLLTRAEAAKYLRRAKRTLAAWDAQGKHNLKPIKIGKRIVLYRLSSLNAFLQEQMKPE